MSRTQSTQKGASMEIKKTYKFFDLDTLELKSEDRTITFEPAKDLAEAQARVGGDESTLLKALNTFLRSEALKAAEAEVTAKGGKRSVVLAVAKPFRALPPFSQMFVMVPELDENKVPTGKQIPLVKDGEKVIDRKAQTKAILELVKSNAAMLETIKAGSASDSDEDSDESDE